MQYANPKAWPDHGIRRPDIATNSNEVKVHQVYELPDGTYGFMLDWNTDGRRERHDILVHLEKIPDSDQLQVSMAWFTAPDEDSSVPDEMRGPIVESLSSVGQETCWREAAARRVDMEAWLREEFESTALFEVLYVYELPNAHFAMRLRSLDDVRTEFIVQVFYELHDEATRCTFQFIRPALGESEPDQQIEAIMERLGMLVLDQRGRELMSARRLDFMGPLTGPDPEEDLPFAIVAGGKCDDGSAWARVRFKLSDGGMAAFVCHATFQRLSESGNPEYSISIASKSVGLVEGRDAPLHAVLHHIGLCMETDRLILDTPECSELVGVEARFEETSWSTEGMPQIANPLLRVTEARADGEGHYFFRLRVTRPNALPVEFPMTLFVNDSFDDQRVENLQLPGALDEREPLFLAVRRVIAQVRERVFRATNQDEPTRREQLEGLRVELRKDTGASRDLSLRTVSCLDYGNYELHIVIEMENDLGDHLRALTAFRNFQFHGSEAQFEMRVLVAPLEEYEHEALELLARQVAARVAQLQEHGA